MWLKNSVHFPIWPNAPFDAGWNRAQRGLWAERAVARRLWKKGHRVLEHRWVASSRSDIDLVAAAREYLIFAEVKFRTEEEDNVWFTVFDVDRKRRLCGAIGEYLHQSRQQIVNLRINGYLVHADPTDSREPRILCHERYIRPESVPGWRGIRSEEWEEKAEPVLL